MIRPYTQRVSHLTSRRSLLQMLSSIGATAMIGNRTSAQETTTTTKASVEGVPIILGGETEHWFGLTPSPIHGQENPTLTLKSGQKYTLIWVNLDGAEHELIIENANDKELIATESASTPGTTKAITFTANNQMDQYYCEYHPQSMRANIKLGNGFQTEGQQTTTTRTTTQ